MNFALFKKPTVIVPVVYCFPTIGGVHAPTRPDNYYYLVRAMADNLIPSVQFSDGEEVDRLLQTIVEELSRNGIATEVRPLDTIPSEDLPDWADRTTGRWLVYVDRERMQHAMELIGTICGYAPGTLPND